MPSFLILKLHGPMQAWGGHTFEDYRPTELFPTRSGLVGLLAACLGIDRADLAGQQALSASFRYAARADRRAGPDGRELAAVKITDYHTILDARKVDGRKNEYPVQSRREYLCDAQFTLALEFLPDAAYSPESIRLALDRPHYTPFLGRRSCPITRPIFESVIEAADLLAALAATPPHAGVVYAELASSSSQPSLRMRDVPTFVDHRQFQTRTVHIIPQEASHVP